MVSAAIIAEISAPHRASCEDCLPQSSTDCTLDRDNMPSREKWYRKNLCFQVKNMSVKVWETVSVYWAAHEKWEIHAKEEITFMILIAQFLGQEIKRHKDWINEMPAWNCELVAFSECSNRHVGMSSPTNPLGSWDQDMLVPHLWFATRRGLGRKPWGTDDSTCWIWGHIQKRQGRDRYQQLIFWKHLHKECQRGRGIMKTSNALKSTLCQFYFQQKIIVCYLWDRLTRSTFHSIPNTSTLALLSWFSSSSCESKIKLPCQLESRKVALIWRAVADKFGCTTCVEEQWWHAWPCLPLLQSLSRNNFSILWKIFWKTYWKIIPTSKTCEVSQPTIQASAWNASATHAVISNFL